MCLGVLHKDENISDEMIDIMTFLHQFVPSDGESIKPVLCFGDELTCERLHNAQEDRRDSSTVTTRLEGLIGCIADFHAFGNFLGVRVFLSNFIHPFMS